MVYFPTAAMLYTDIAGTARKKSRLFSFIEKNGAVKAGDARPVTMTNIPQRSLRTHFDTVHKNVDREDSATLCTVDHVARIVLWFVAWILFTFN